MYNNIKYMYCLDTTCTIIPSTCISSDTIIPSTCISSDTTCTIISSTCITLILRVLA